VNKDNSHVQIVERNGTIVGNDGIPKLDEVIPIVETPSMAMA